MDFFFKEIFPSNFNMEFWCLKIMMKLLALLIVLTTAL